jgi:uroporphyrinogen decarboxylase
MNSRQRMLAALRCEQPDRVPVFEMYINEPNIVEIAQALRPDAVHVAAGRDRFGQERSEVLDLYALVVQELGLDATSTNFSIGIEPLGPDRGRDKYGTLYRLSEHGEPCPIDGPIRSLADLDGFDMAARLHPDDFAVPRHVIDTVGPAKAHIVCVTDPFKVSWRRRGSMQNLLMDYVTDPELVHGLARMASRFVQAAIDHAVDIGADIIAMPGDLAGEHSTLISPRHYREYLKPYHQEIVAHAHHRGVPIIKHTDGNMWPILDDLVEVGFDGIHPFQPQCMDIGEAKAHLAGRACVIGNIDCRELLPFGTPDQVVAAVRDTLAQAAPGGGYILTSSNSIHPGCQAANYIAMVQATHRYGVYEAPA